MEEGQLSMYVFMHVQCVHVCGLKVQLLVWIALPGILPCVHLQAGSLVERYCTEWFKWVLGICIV